MCVCVGLWEGEQEQFLDKCWDNEADLSQVLFRLKKGKLVISKNATRKKKREKKRDTKNASTLTVYQLEL